MKIEMHNTLIQKAKTRKDGIYTYQGVFYVVKKGCFWAYADYSGEIQEIFGVFHHYIGKVERWERKNKLKELYLS